MRGGSAGQYFRALWLRARRSPGVLLTSEVGGRTDMQGTRLDSLLVARLGHSHPDKTFIGRIDIGFNFLGYHFGPDGLSVAKKTV